MTVEAGETDTFSVIAKNIGYVLDSEYAEFMTNNHQPFYLTMNAPQYTVHGMSAGTATLRFTATKSNGDKYFDTITVTVT